jgi:hypothetical protein
MSLILYRTKVIRLDNGQGDDDEPPEDWPNNDQERRLQSTFLHGFFRLYVSCRCLLDFVTNFHACMGQSQEQVAHSVMREVEFDCNKISS